MLRVHVSIRWALVFVLLCAFVILPFVLFGEEFEEGISSFLSAKTFSLAQSGLVIGLLASDVFLPVPSILLATFAGAAFGLMTGSVVIWLGLMVGAGIGYGVGAGLGLASNSRLFSNDERERAQLFFKDYGGVGLALTRPIPVLAEIGLIGAGICGYSIPRFFTVTALSNAGLSVAYAYLGSLAEQSGSLLLLLAAAIILPLIGLIVWQVTRAVRA